MKPALMGKLFPYIWEPKILREVEGDVEEQSWEVLNVAMAI